MARRIPIWYDSVTTNWFICGWIYGCTTSGLVAVEVRVDPIAAVSKSQSVSVGQLAAGVGDRTIIRETGYDLDRNSGTRRRTRTSRKKRN